MLEHLRITNFAIIEELDVAFHDGLNVLTGETGAGKSIIIGALNLVLGSRADTDQVRSGQDSAVVEARFRVEDAATRALLEEMGLPLEDDTLLVRRVLSAKDKNRVFINGAGVTVAQLERIGRRLVDLHGQHDHQSLLHPETHVELLDRFGNLDAVRNAFSAAFQEHQAAAQKLRQAQTELSSRLQRQDLLRFQIQEIDEAAPDPEEEERLLAERNRLRHAEQLHQALTVALDHLAEGAGCVLERLGRVRRDLEPLTALDASLSPQARRTDTAFFETEELAAELRDYLQSLEFSPARQETLEERFQILNGLKRKYGGDLPAVLQHREDIGRELASLTLSGEARAALEKQVESLAGILTRQAALLAEAREGAAVGLKKGAERELKDLSMKQVRFDIRFDYPEDAASPAVFRKRRVSLTPTGLGRLEFVFSPNPGEALRPLAKIASGGELSRVMLALKSLLNHQSTVPVLVFDEVDAGISGRVAETVGVKLKTIAARKQVFCITHLPQIAGMAGTQYRVRKTVSGRRTRTVITELDYEARVEEIARLSAGETITATTLLHAREMIK